MEKLSGADRAARIETILQDQRIEELESGGRRLRVIVDDEDGYAGWIEKTCFLGLLDQRETTGEVIIEEHFPYMNPERRWIACYKPSGEIETLFAVDGKFFPGSLVYDAGRIERLFDQAIHELIIPYNPPINYNTLGRKPNFITNGLN